MEVYRHLRRITFPVNVTQRVAFLVQEWSACSAPAKAGGPLRFKVVLTQEEIAQMVDSTRETVSRVLTDLRRKGWLRIKGVTWTVTNPEAMKELAEWGSTSRP
jgi:CRP-like cAMP-binding protein